MKTQQQEATSEQIKDLILLVKKWRQKWEIKYSKIEIKIKEDVAFVSVTNDYTPQDFKIQI